MSLLTTLALTAPATAAIRAGTVTDPVGDSAGAPSQDIVSATASYDTNGQVNISATMNGDIASGPDSFFSIRIASYQPPTQCLGAGASIFGFYTSAFPSLMIDGVSGIGDATKVVTGNTFGVIRTLPQLANKDWSCVTLVVTPRDAGGTTLDQLNVPLFFDGFGPAPAPAATPQPAAPVSTPQPAAPVSSPAAPASEPAAPILRTVRPGRAFASATVQVATRSTLTAQLLRGNRIVGSARVTVGSGTQHVKVALQKKVQRQLRRRGLKRVALKLRVVVAPQTSAAQKKTFTRPVVVRL